MSIAYLYSDVMLEVASRCFSDKIEGEVGIAPEKVYVCGSYVYVRFAEALSSEAKSALDAVVSARGGVYKLTDLEPGGVVCIGQSPDGSIWKFLLDDQGVITTVKPVTES